MKTVLSVDVAKNKSMIMLMNSDGEIFIDTKEINHNLEDFEKAVLETHKDNDLYRKQYLKEIEKVRVLFDLV